MMMATGQDLSQILHEQLLCYICESGLKAGKYHWYRCTQGHIICQDCKEIKEKKNCSCKKSFVPQHCNVIEALLSANKMRFKCENFRRGCQNLLNKENMTFHHAECLYRLVQCPRIPRHSKAFQFFNGKDTISIPVKFEIETNSFFAVGKETNGSFYHWLHFYDLNMKQIIFHIPWSTSTRTRQKLSFLKLVKHCQLMKLPTQSLKMENVLVCPAKTLLPTWSRKALASTLTAFLTHLNSIWR
mgnify:FL=1